MIYKFYDIDNDEIYSRSCMLIIKSYYSVFQNYIIDKLKNVVGIDKFNSDITEEFNGEDDGISWISIEDFLRIGYTPGIAGRWMCRIDASLLSKKQKEMVKEYIKSANSNGLLIITISNWKDSNEFKNIRELRVSREINEIQLNYPDRKTLSKIIKHKFDGIEVEDKAVDLFINKLNREYDEYDNVIKDIIDINGKDNKI